MSTKFKDFSKPRERVYFTVSGTEFDCIPAVPVDVLQEMVTETGEVTAANLGTALRRFFKMTLTEESFAVMDRKLGDKVDPIDSEQASDIMHWLLEVYGMRPTQPSSDSSAGSKTVDGGTSSTAGVVLDPSTPSL